MWLSQGSEWQSQRPPQSCPCSGSVPDVEAWGWHSWPWALPGLSGSYQNGGGQTGLGPQIPGASLPACRWWLWSLSFPGHCLQWLPHAQPLSGLQMEAGGGQWLNPWGWQLQEALCPLLLAQGLWIPQPPGFQDLAGSPGRAAWAFGAGWRAPLSSGNSAMQTWCLQQKRLTVAWPVLGWRCAGWRMVWRHPQGEGRDLQPGCPLATLLGPQGLFLLGVARSRQDPRPPLQTRNQKRRSRPRPSRRRVAR